MCSQSVRQRRPSDRKAQLASVAAELFRARGFHEVGVADIATAAGVTAPALYRHFDDKHAILAHVVLSGIDELINTTKDALGGSDTPAQAQIEALLANLATLSIERRDVAALWRREGRSLDADNQREVGRRATELISWWESALRATRPELDRSTAQLLCWAVLSVFGSVAVHSTRIGKGRHIALLVGSARAVLHSSPHTEDAPVVAAPIEFSVLRASRRDQLVTEATRLFQERGFHEVSMEDIGKAAGIAGPSVYRHFASKAALYMAGAQRIADRLELGRHRVARAATDEVTALSGLVASYVETMRGCADMMAVGRQVRAISANERAELRRIQRDYVAEWVRLLSAVRPQLTTADARVTVHITLTIANDLLYSDATRHRPGIESELVSLMTRALGIVDQRTAA